MLRRVTKKTAIILIVMVLFTGIVTASIFSNFFKPKDNRITGYATLTGSCTVVPAGECGGAGVDEVCLGRALATTNTHLATPDITAYPYCVCCSGTDLSNECLAGSSAVFASLLATDNSHAAVPGTAGYNVNLCLSVTSGTVSCETSTGSCPAGTTCIMKLSSETNAHAESCNDFTNNYQTYLCCAVTEGEEQCIDGEGSECTREGLACCDIGEQPAHCSFGRYNDLGTGHCCPERSFYNHITGLCQETEECGFGGELTCPYDPENPAEYLFWLAEPNCVNAEEGVSCCPNVDWYGEPGNYLVPIHIYTGPE